jgi:hypothetical protein
MDIKEIGWEGVGWIHLAYDGEQQWADINMIMNFQLP